MATTTAASSRWLESGTRAVITMARVPDHPTGYNVRLDTTRNVGSELTRKVFCADVFFAASRVTWLMQQVPGEWQPVEVA